jgi:hypothetical protein
MTRQFHNEPSMVLGPTLSKHHLLETLHQSIALRLVTSDWFFGSPPLGDVQERLEYVGSKHNACTTKFSVVVGLT